MPSRSSRIGHFEVVGGGVDSTVARAGAAGGVVVVAELLSAQGGGAATAARGVDVAAEITLDGDFGELGGVGCVGHEMPPPGLLRMCAKIVKMTKV